MAKIEITLPAMGEGVVEATITKWLVKEGDRVEEDQSVVEVATDKVDSEIPSPESGVITKIFFSEGDVPQVGDVLAWLENDKPEEDLNRPEVLVEVEKVKEEVLEEQKEEAEEKEPETGVKDMANRTPSGKFLSPLVRKIAKEEGITYEELDRIEGTGMDGRITRDDVLAWLKAKKEGKTDVSVRPPAEKVPEPPVRPPVEETAGVARTPVQPAGTTVEESDEVEIIEMDRVRKLIADHMVYSKQTSPHVTSFIEADVTGLVQWRERVKEEFLQRTGQKVTYTPVFIHVAAMALHDFPMVNVSVEGTKILRKKHINIGMATALPNGNLIVPVIRDADEKSLLGLVKAVNDLAGRARDNKLQPDEIRGGTFTITNFGTFRNLTGTPIINQPEAAILGVGAILKKPAVVETPHGDAIAIRHIIVLSLSYDHRVIDGALAGMFLERVAYYLENFDADKKL